MTPPPPFLMSSYWYGPLLALRDTNLPIQDIRDTNLDTEMEDKDTMVLSGAARRQRKFLQLFLPLYVSPLHPGLSKPTQNVQKH